MKDLIEALTILAKYQKPTRNPTHCSHDQLTVVGIVAGAVPADEVDRLGKLGFRWSDEDEAWISFRFGSA